MTSPPSLLAPQNGSEKKWPTVLAKNAHSYYFRHYTSDFLCLSYGNSLHNKKWRALGGGPLAGGAFGAGAKGHHDVIIIR